MKIFAPAAALIVALLLVLSQSMFMVDQRQFAVVFQLGELIRIKDEPGLSWKVPLLQNVRFFDKRILTLDTSEAERFLTSEKKNVLVDLFVKWRIVDTKQFYETISSGSASVDAEERAKARLSQTVNAILREEFGKRTVHEVVSGERDRIMEIVRQKGNLDAKTFGAEIVDVRLKRVDYVQEISDSVYRRMEAERKRVANELRSEGAAEKERIQADADKQREVILAEAYKKAQQIKGAADAKATSVYSAAYGQNAEFYAFYRSLEAYKQSFKSKGDVLVLEPNAEFFKYLKNSNPGKSGK
ncbi:MAG: protease modulator HflC [Betaproteobacteria bacterium]|nr:protease modulator HflC [Betaproteobacteria bacterium]MBK9606074.1 protease modulator HflC [Betaproteobacteria bacterium]